MPPIVALLLAAFWLALCGVDPGRALAASGHGAGQGGPQVQTAAMLPAAAPSLRPGAARQQAAEAVAARLGVHPDKTRFVLEMTGAATFRIALQAQPYRLVLDFPDLVWRAAMPGRPGGLIRAMDWKAQGGTGLRIVLDTAGPVHVHEAFVLPPRDGRLSRFVLDLEPSTPSAFAAEPRQITSPRIVDPATRAALAEAGVSSPPATSVPEAAPGAAPAPTASPPPGRAAATPASITVPAPPPSGRRPGTARQKPLVMIDPGHGGEDPGAIGINGVFEKSITLATARALREALIASGRYRAALTRDDDVFVRLRDRVGKARDAGADLFISLHADSIDSDDVQGMSIYSLSDNASDREAAMLAARENRADALGGVDLAAESDQVVSILIDLAQRNTKNQSRRFANLLVREMRTNRVGLLQRPHRSAGFAVLTSPDVPSVLIEMGYLSSVDDARLLTQPGHRNRLARAILRGIDGYFAALPGLSRS